jgi:predicted dinucleotide-binding enzyme
MFVCGDDEASKPAVLRLVADIGFEAIDAGGATVARLLEPFGMLWIHLANARGLGRDWAFGVLRRGSSQPTL